MTTPAKLSRLAAELGELIAARARRAKDRRDFARYADDPSGFIRDVLKGEPWAKQDEIAAVVRDNPLVAVQSANAVGKDWIAAALALWWVFARRGLVLLTGPSERQVHEILMRTEIARFFHRARLPGELFTGALRLPGDGALERVGILAQTSSESSKLTGHHAPRILVVITEAQGVEEYAWEALLACAVGSEDRVLAIGNPVAPVGRFFTVTRPSSSWRTIKISAFAHPNVVQSRTVIPGGVTRAFIERIRENFGGVQSPAYLARVLGEFPETSVHALFSRAALEAAVTRHERGVLDEESRASEWLAGVDVARFGDDRTCVAIARGPVLRELILWHGLDTMETTGRVIEEMRARRLGAPKKEPWDPGVFGVPDPALVGDPALTLVVDVIGIGSGVADRLQEQGWSVVEHNSSGKPRDQPRFKNRRAETYWNLRALLEQNAVALPRDEALFEELLATQYEIDSSGKIKIEAKDDLRARLGRSPDRADAVTMALGASDYTTGGGDLDVNL